MSKKQTGTNNVFDEALEDFVESRRARARLAKNHRTLAASVRKKLKVRESEVGRLPDALSPVSTTGGGYTRGYTMATRSYRVVIPDLGGIHARNCPQRRRKHARTWG